MNVAMDRLLDDAVLEAVDRLRPIADEAGLSMAELALAWVLRRPEVASAIVGASRPEQVHANTRASGLQLTPDTLAAIEEALDDTPVKQPTLAPLATRRDPQATWYPIREPGSRGLSADMYIGRAAAGERPRGGGVRRDRVRDARPGRSAHVRRSTDRGHGARSGSPEVVSSGGRSAASTT
jgi:hypothetical protein